MRVLVTSTAGTGHIYPIAPLARALRSAGHDIVWATGPEGCRTVERLGFDARRAGLDVGPRTAAFLDRAPQFLTAPVRERRAIALSVMFAEVAASAMYPDLVEVFDEVRPDLVLHDLAEMAAAPIASARGIPHVTIGFSGSINDAMQHLVIDSIEPVWTAQGATASVAGFYGDLLLHPFPHSLDTPRADVPSAPMRPVPVDEPDPVEAEAVLLGFGAERPGVYVTFGTQAPPGAPWPALVEAIGDLDVDVIATVGLTFDPTSLGTVPPNLQVERFVPQAALLDRASVVVSHAGAGTSIGAAAAGTVHVFIPLAADQWENADLLTAAGAGVTLELDQRDAVSIRSSIEGLLTDSAAQSAVDQLQVEIADMPHPAEVVPRLEALT